MAMRILPTDLPSESVGREKVGREKQTKLAGELSAHFRGILTHQLLETLWRADPNCETFGDLERSLQEVFEHDVSMKVTDVIRGQLVLANNMYARSTELLLRLDRQAEREIIASLKEVIRRRELEGDYWPEGRLNLGIAYACLGEYEAAKRWLEDAVNILRYPSYVPRSQQMAA